MTRMRTHNTDLAAALQPYSRIPLILGGITGALGVRPGEALTEAEYPVLGFFLRPGESVFAAYLLTPGRFVVHELGAGGESLTVALPLSRVRRVVESSVPGRLTLTVEMDADRTVTRTESEHLDEAVLGAEELGRRVGRSLATATTTSAVYEISATYDAEESPDGTDESDALRDFAISFRSALGT